MLFPLFQIGPMSPKKSTADETLLTVADIASRLNVTGRAVTKWCNQGKFAGAFKLGQGRSNWRIPTSGYDQFVNERKESAQTGVV